MRSSTFSSSQPGESSLLAGVEEIRVECFRKDLERRWRCGKKSVDTLGVFHVHWSSNEGYSSHSTAAIAASIEDRETVGCGTYPIASIRSLSLQIRGRVRLSLDACDVRGRYPTVLGSSLSSTIRSSCHTDSTFASIGVSLFSASSFPCGSD